MTLYDLRAALATLRAGQSTGISREEYADLFPPGERDEQARASCQAFAGSAGCRVEAISERHSIWFVKTD
jgi:hypothetical protein